LGSDTVVAATRPARRPAPWRALVAACAGNLVEWYEFAIYGAVATIIAATFFPGAGDGAGLLPTFALFATTFLARPVGAVLFGRLGDRLGRTRVLAAMIIMMSLATAAIGVLPGHRAIGLAAPLLLLALRVLQGLSVGGEAGSASAFAVEYAPQGQRGWYGAWIWATVSLGLGTAVATAALLAALLPPGVFEAWGWRLAFLLALPLGLAGWYLRLQFDETPWFKAVERDRAVAERPLGEALRRYPGRVLVGFVLVAAASLTFNTFFVFLPNHLVVARGVPLRDALGASLGGLALMAAASPALGRLSDRVGRKPVLAAGTLGLLVATIPAYLLIRRGGPVGLPLGYLMVGAGISCMVLPTFVAELFPTPVRASALAITYGLATALIGGTGPFLDTLLVQRTGNQLLPAYYAGAVTLAAAVGALLIKETAFAPLDPDERGSRTPSSAAG
jgi:MHS family proline/betaine transporter-like MFS transporter